MKKVILALGVVILFATCKKDIPQKQLTVNVTPEVGGSVTPSSGTYAMGSNVKLTATPSAEYVFCLLYTSPSPRDRQKSRMPSSA